MRISAMQFGPLLGLICICHSFSAQAEEIDADLPKFALQCLASSTPSQSLLKEGGADTPVISNDGIDIWIERSGGRISLAKGLLRTGKLGRGWYELKAIEIDPHQITALISDRLRSKPKIWISRATGNMTITSDKMNVVGMCSAFDTQVADRSF